MFSNKAGTQNPLSRGEGAPQGRERNAGRNVASKYNLSGLLKRRKCVGSLSILRIARLPPAFLFSQRSVPQNQSLTASPRGKRLGRTAIQQFDMLGIIAQFQIGLTANAILCIAGSGLPRRFAPRNDVVVGQLLHLSYLTRHCEGVSPWQSVPRNPK